MKKLLVFLTMVALMTSFVAASTTSVITNATNRLVTLQVPNGGWEWTSTNNNTGVSTSSNVVGVTALGLLDAYSLIGDVNYLNSAKKAGDYLIGHLFTGGGLVDTNVRVNAFDIVFFYKLGEVGGNNTYTQAADKLLYNVLHEKSYFSTGGEYGNYCDSDGCTAQELFNGVEHRRIGNGIEIALWDLSRWVEAAELGRETTWASALKNLMDQKCTSSTSCLNSGNGFYVVGLSGLVLATKNTYAIDLLKGSQDDHGSWDGWIQDTAYALMALDSVGQTAVVTDAASYLVNQFGYGTPTLINGWKDGNDEYPEVNSEAIQALYDFLATEGNEDVNGTLEDFYWSISVTPSPLQFGAIPRGSEIFDEADNDPIKIDATGSETVSDSVYVKVDVIGTDASFYDLLLELRESGFPSWIDITGLGILAIPEHGSKSYYARLHGDTSNLPGGSKSATIVYTAYGEPL
jgi:hypothetical protein